VNRSSTQALRETICWIVAPLAFAAFCVCVIWTFLMDRLEAVMVVCFGGFALLMATWIALDYYDGALRRHAEKERYLREGRP